MVNKFVSCVAVSVSISAQAVGGIAALVFPAIHLNFPVRESGKKPWIIIEQPESLGGMI